MKRIYQELLLAVFLGMVVPGAVLQTAVRRTQAQQSAPIEIVQQTKPATEQTIEVLLPDGTVETMNLDVYLVGVVLAEMPAGFETETLKAQAVVARTYTLKCAGTGVKHGYGRICTDHSCCQAFTESQTYAGGQEALEKVRSAVYATTGEVLTYEGELIEATYFSCSGGTTEDAVAVWGTDFPYLRSVSSPGEEGAAYYTDSIYLTAEEFQSRLGRELSGSPKSWLGFTTYTAGGGVNTIRIGNEDYKGTDIRMKLGLRSTAFNMTADANGITVDTKGFGHRVGMSQYGADAMAVRGSNYTDILAHYYQGTILSTYEN